MYAILCKTMKKGLIITLLVLFGLILLTWGTEKVLTQFVYTPERVTARVNEGVRPLIPVPYSLGESRLSISRSFPLVALETKDVVLFNETGKDTLFYAPLMRSVMTWRDWNHPDMLRIQLTEPTNKQLEMTVALSDFVPEKKGDSINPLILLDTYYRFDASLLDPYLQDGFDTLANIISHFAEYITRSQEYDSMNATNRGMQGMVEMRVHFDTCRWNTLAQLDWKNIKGSLDFVASPLKLRLFNQSDLVVQHYHLHSQTPINDSINALLYQMSPVRNPNHMSYAYHSVMNDVEIHFPSTSIGIPEWTSDYYGLFDLSVKDEPYLLHVRKQNLKSMALHNASKSVYVLHPRMMMQGVADKQKQLWWDCFVQLDSVVVKDDDTFLTLRSGSLEHNVLNAPAKDFYPDLSFTDILEDVVDNVRKY